MWSKKAEKQHSYPISNRIMHKNAQYIHTLYSKSHQVPLVVSWDINKSPTAIKKSVITTVYTSNKIENVVETE